MRVNVPDNLRGSSLLAAHGWVKSQIRTNPGGDDAQYTLTDVETGHTVVLTDLTKGKVKSVDIGFDDQGAVGINPSPSYFFSEQRVSRPRPGNSQVWMMLPEDIRPSVVHKVIAKEGLFRGVQSLTKMLHSQMDEINIYSPVSRKLLATRSLEDMSGFVRANPGKRGSGFRSPSQVLGGSQDLVGREIDKRIKEYLVEEGYSHQGYDAPLGDYVMSEVNQLVSNHRLPNNFTANKKTFDAFNRKVAKPYIISSIANRNLLLYLNRTLIPHMRRLIDEGKFTRGTIPGHLAKVSKAAAKDGLKQTLSRRYEFIVNRLATNPKAFYYGKADALVAHPGFMFPQFGLMILPLPKQLDGNTPAESFLRQAGEEPEYGRNKKGEFVRQMGTDEHHMIAQLTGRVKMGQMFDLDWFRKQITDFNVLPVMDALADELFLGGNSWLMEPGIATDEIVDVSGKLGKKFREGGKIKVGEASVGAVAAIEFDLPGLKPSPLGWPEPLVFAMLESMFEHRELLLKLEDDDNDDPLWKPSISSRFKFDPMAFVHVVNYDNNDNVKEDMSGKVRLVDLLATEMGYNQKEYKTLTGSDIKIKDAKEKAIQLLTNQAEAKDEKDKRTIALHKFIQIATNDGVGLVSLAVEPGSMSIMQLLKETVEGGRIKYNFDPTNDDIAFILHLMIYTVKCVGSTEDGGIGAPIRGFFEKIVGEFQDDYKEGRDKGVSELNKLVTSVQQDDSYTPLEKAAYLEAIASSLETLVLYEMDILSNPPLRPGAGRMEVSKESIAAAEQYHDERSIAEREAAAEREGWNETPGVKVNCKYCGTKHDPRLECPIKAKASFQYQKRRRADEERRRRQQQQRQTVGRRNPPSLESFEKMNTHINRLNIGPDDIDAVISKLHAERDENIKKSGFGVLTEDQKTTMVSAFAETLGEVVGDAYNVVLQEAQEKADEAEALQRRTDLLGDFVDAKEGAHADLVLRKQNKAIHEIISDYLDQEARLIEELAGVIPTNIKSVIKTQVNLRSGGSHLSFDFRDWRVTYNSFMEYSKLAEKSLANILMSVRSEASLQRSEDNAWDRHVNTLKSAIKMIQEYRTQYGQQQILVDDVSETLLEKLQAKRGPPAELYKLALEIEKVAKASEGSRKELVKSYYHKKPKKMFKPIKGRFADALKALSNNIDEAKASATIGKDGNFEQAIEWMMKNHGNTADDDDWFTSLEDDVTRELIALRALDRTPKRRGAGLNFRGATSILQDVSVLKNALAPYGGDLNFRGAATAEKNYKSIEKQYNALVKLGEPTKAKVVDLLFKARSALQDAVNTYQE